MKRSTIDIWVGLFVAAGILALLFLALKVSNPNGFNRTAGYTLTANFDNIGGLKVNAAVRSAGVVVGRVTKVRFDNTLYKAEVTMELNADNAFSTDSSAEILTAGLLGEQYLGLTTGADTTMLKSGDKINVTSSALVLEQLIGQMLFNKAGEAKPASQP